MVDAPPQHATAPGIAALRWLLTVVVGWLAAQAAALVVFAASPPRGIEAVAAAIEAAVRDGPVSTAGTASLARLALQQVAPWAVLLGAVALAATHRGTDLLARARLDIRPRLADLPLGLVAGVGAQALVGGAYLLLGIDADDPARRLVGKGQGVAGVLALYLLFAVVAPVVEEWFYRGLLLWSLADLLGRVPGLLVSALVFGFVHFQLVQLPGLIVAGLVFGALAVRAGRLAPAVVAHLAFNATTVTWLIVDR
jgi:membrane protease YdiL (CAAX protease family)